ncbi:hypothetical protein [Paenibacillus sp. HJGM_3]|uniref:hypothetical protein n=1 Tax=Paenibacillus sp. HJGM_3 TaxID=3379816 RepID=UPI003858369F
MSDIYSLLADTLSGIGYPVREQGTFADENKLPETFITYFVVDTPNNSHADNLPTSRTTRAQITLYSKKPALKQGADASIKAVMLPAGFLRVGGRDLPYNPKTGHYAYTCDYRYYELEE